MYLVYCDDSREKQVANPYQSLCAVILKDSSFKETESYMGYIIEQLVPEEKRDDFEFHAVDLFNGLGAFQGISREEALTIFDMCMDMVL